jgi:hypothetical protein
MDVMNTRRRAAALLEVLGVYLSGTLLAVMIVKMLLGFQVPNPLANFTANISDAGLLTATRQMFVVLVLQYAFYFVLIVPINWWHRRRGPAAYGLTTSGHSRKALLLAGAATAAIATCFPGDEFGPHCLEGRQDCRVAAGFLRHLMATMGILAFQRCLFCTGARTRGALLSRILSAKTRRRLG